MNDMQDLRERFDAAGVPPTRLTTDTLLHAGRRRVLRRRVVQASCGVALATGLLAVAPTLVLRPSSDQAAGYAEPVRCETAALPMPAGLTSADAVAVDPSGRFVIGNHVGKEIGTPKLKAGMSELTPVLWTDGRPQALPMVDRSTRASAVNASGVVVAVAGDEEQYNAVVRYTGGVPAVLTPPAGEWTFQLTPQINATGDIIANGTRTGGESVVLLWKAGSATATQLPLPAGAEAADITDNGTIVGARVTGRDVTDLTAFAWDQTGGYRLLPVPAGQHGSPVAARGDWATGSLWPSGSAARWNLVTGEMTDLNYHGPVHSINAKGWMTGDNTVLRDDATVELAAAGTDRPEPTDISDNGVVIGEMLADSPGTPTAVSGPYTWKCEA